jgi:transcriptional regulator with XRE-family HTH domain
VEICSIKPVRGFFAQIFTQMIQFLSNPQIEQELGKRLKAHRLDLNLSQEQIATRSGLSRRTITAIENGEGSTLTTLIALLRALNALDTLENFLPDPGISPMAMTSMLQDAPRKYASKPRKTPPPTPWKWGDEK